MVKPHGRMNKHALEQFSNSLSGSGIVRSQIDGNGSFKIDVNQTVVELQKNQAVEPGVGRVVVLKGQTYIPKYNLGIGATPGSGFTVTSDGIYLVDATVSVSGVAIEGFAGTVLVNSVPASGTTSAAFASAQGAATVKIHGIVNVVNGQNINVGIKSLHGNITAIGSEDLVIAPAANIRIVKLGSDELAFNG